MAIDATRPSPEQFLNLIRRQERGRLKVYLGSAAGVGKTYAMLREGHRLKKQGVDVGDRLRRDPRPRRDRRAGRRPGGHPAPGDRVPGRDPARDGPRRDPRAPAHRLPGRRAGAHQRPGQPPPQALPGRRGAAPGRHPRHHDGQRPAPGEPLRRGRAGHRREGQGAAPRLGPGRGRPDRQRRRLGRGPAGAAEGRQGLPAGAGRAGAGELLHARQPDPAARDRADGDRPPDRPPRPPRRGGPGAGLGGRSG